MKHWHKIVVEPAFETITDFDKALNKAKELQAAHECLVDLLWNGITVCVDTRRNNEEHWELYLSKAESQWRS